MKGPYNSNDSYINVLFVGPRVIFMYYVHVYNTWMNSEPLFWTIFGIHRSRNKQFNAPMSGGENRQSATKWVTQQVNDSHVKLTKIRVSRERNGNTKQMNTWHVMAEILSPLPLQCQFLSVRTISACHCRFFFFCGFVIV